MATINKTKSGTWKAQIRLAGWPNQTKTFRIKRDAENWARTTEDEIIRGIHIPRTNSEKLTVASALDRYVKEVVPTKKASGHRRDAGRAEFLKSRLGQYSLAALNSELIAEFRDQFAQQRYLELTDGLLPRRLGGPRLREMTDKEREIDTIARLTVSSELGHSRIEITRTYLG